MSYRNEFDEEPNDFFGGLISTVRRAGPRIVIGALVIGLLILGGIFIGAYPDQDQAGEQVPIIRADADPYKVAPDDPGGMQIAHRDSTIYSTMRGDDGDKVENLLDDNETEEPLPRSQLFAGLNTDEAAPPQPETPDNTAAETSAPQPERIEGIADTAPAAGTEEPAAPDEEELASMEQAASAVSQIEPTAGAATVAPKAIASGTHFVQLASIRDKAQAASEWKKLQAKYSGLSGMDYRVQTADLGAKGTFYRIQAGPMAKDGADTLCGSIKKTTPGACMVVAK